jgi:hypothetical protein
MFDLERWRQEAQQRLRPFLQRPRQEPVLVGTSSLFTYLAVRTLEPFLEAYQDDPIAGTLALATITRAPGANTLIRMATQLRYQGALLLRRELYASGPLRATLEQILLQLGVIDLVKQGLNDTQCEWFRLTLQHEIEPWTMNGELRGVQQALASPPWQLRYATIQSLRDRDGTYSPDELAMLQGGLQDTSSHVRAAAARGLGHMRGTIPMSVRQSLLDAALHDRDLGARYAAARALGTLRDHIISDDLIELLVTALFDEDSFVRSAASLVLGQLGEQIARPVVIDSLISVLKDRDPYAREASAQALGRLGLPAATRETLSALGEALLDTDYYVHEAALNAIARLRPLLDPTDEVSSPALVA